jgi:hypothetical protein
MLESLCIHDMAADTLSKLFGSETRVKLLRLFLFNPKTSFTTAEAAARTRAPGREVARELAMLVSIELVTKTSRNRTGHYALNPEFPYLGALQNLLLNASARAGDIYERIKRIGVVKLVVVSGIFVGEWESRIDLLVVADRAREASLEKYMRILESEIGREIRYTLLTTQEFFYRLNMNDHLLRDVLDYTHRIMFDRLDIGLK